MSKNKKIIFLDRDGVINKDPGGWTEHNYVTNWSQFVFLPNSIKALKQLNEAGYDIVLISNQGGISKGYFTESELYEVNKKMLEEIEKSGAKIKKVYYCIHHDKDNCNCRKPKTGLFDTAENQLDFDCKDEFFIGDGRMDVEAGSKKGLKTILVLSGKTNIESVKDWVVKPDYIFKDLKEASDFVIKMKGPSRPNAG